MKKLEFSLNKHNSYIHFDNYEECIYINFAQNELYFLHKQMKTINGLCTFFKVRKTETIIKKVFNMSIDNINYILDNEYNSFPIDKIDITFKTKDPEDSELFSGRLKLNNKYHLLFLVLLFKDEYKESFFELRYHQENIIVNSIEDIYKKLDSIFYLEFNNYQKDKINAEIINRKFLK